MGYTVRFPRSCTDLFGYVSPWAVLQGVNECLSRELDLDGVGVVRLLKELGATWMMGQLEVEYLAPVRHSVPLKVEVLPRKNSGVCCLRQAVVQSESEALMRYTGKFLPVSFAERKVLPLSALDTLWKRPGGGQVASFGWVRLPETMELAERETVRHWWCDPNGHMTTYQYLNLVCELAGYWNAGVRVLERVQIDFRKEFVPDEGMSLYRGVENGVTYISGIHDNGTLGFAASVKLSETEFPRSRAY